MAEKSSYTLFLASCILIYDSWWTRIGIDIFGLCNFAVYSALINSQSRPWSIGPMEPLIGVISIFDSQLGILGATTVRPHKNPGKAQPLIDVHDQGDNSCLII